MTYPVRNNNHSNCTNESVAKLQLFFNYIEIYDHDDAKSCKKADSEVYYKESLKVQRDTIVLLQEQQRPLPLPKEQLYLVDPVIVSPILLNVLLIRIKRHLMIGLEQRHL